MQVGFFWFYYNMKLFLTVEINASLKHLLLDGANGWRPTILDMVFCQDF